MRAAGLGELLTPLLKKTQGRSPGGSALWASENLELVRRRRDELGGGIGNYSKAVSQLFESLSEHMQDSYEERAASLKDEDIGDIIDRCFE